MSVLFALGTRPEAIKLLPVYCAFRAAGIPAFLCATMQHKHMLLDFFKVFSCDPDVIFEINYTSGDLSELSGFLLNSFSALLRKHCFESVFVQGDTATVFCASLSAFYSKIPVHHVEAGLRTYDVMAPFPEEFYRQSVSKIAAMHYAPTPRAAHNLLSEGIERKKILITGNTVVDALYFTQKCVADGAVDISADLRAFCQNAHLNGGKLVLLTAHRREAFGLQMDAMFCSIKEFLQQYPHVSCVYPVHRNPEVLKALRRSGFLTIDEQICPSIRNRIFFCGSLLYHELAYLLDRVDLVMTDSGGIQEEAVALGKPVICLREKTERIEGVEVGLVRLVGFDRNLFFQAARDFLTEAPQTLYQPSMVYGDGNASKRICDYYRQTLIDVKTLQITQQQGVKNMEPKFVKDHAFKVCIVGTGYIGLPTALLATRAGYQVHAYDVDATKIEQLRQGRTAICEDDLVVLLQELHTHPELTFDTQPIAGADFYVIAVPTPFIEETKAPDVTIVWQAVKTLAPLITKGAVVLLESTIPVGLTEQVARYLEQETNLIIGADLFVAHCPERVLPGNMLHELVYNDRVIGGITPQCAQNSAEFYRPFVKGSLHLTNASCAEMVKLVENSSRDVAIAFAHQVDSMCQAAGINSWEVINLANRHPRVNILQPSCGVGGHCIAVDPWFLVSAFPEQTQLLAAARRINDDRPRVITERAVAAINQIYTQQRPHGPNGRPLRIALWGLTFKPNVDDLRNSPAISVAQLIAQAGLDIDVHVVEPHVEFDELKAYGFANAVSIEASLANADGIIVLVKHSVFLKVDQKVLHAKLILDACGLLQSMVYKEQVVGKVAGQTGTSVQL